MGLFINYEQHDGMYKNKEKLDGANQTTFQRGYLTELLKEQQKMNETLQKSMLQLGMLQSQSEQKQFKKWHDVSDRLRDLEKGNNRQDQRELQMLEQLIALTDENKKLQMMLENDHLSDQEIIRQIKEHHISNEELSQQIVEQKESQQEVLKRLENQEALTEKMLRQITHLRSSLFERTNDLAETIGDSYKLTATYLYQLLTGTDQPLTFYMHREHKKDK